MAYDQGEQTGIIITTALATFVGGFLLGVWSIQGHIISPSLVEERRRNLHDPVESDAGEVSDGVLDHAPNWANGLDADKIQGLSAVEDEKEECKMVLVVRTDLGMTKGKIAAQCSHATLACYKVLARLPFASPERRFLTRWEKHGQAKVALQVKSEDDLLELRRKAKNLGICAEVIQDAGRTQIESGSLTVLGVGPAPKSLVDKVTGHLKLL